MNQIHIFLVLALTLALSGCTNDTEKQQLLKKNVTIDYGGGFFLSVSEGQDNCTFESRNDLIVEVTGNGTINGKKVGSTYIVVKDASTGFIDSCLVTVKGSVQFYLEPSLDYTLNETAVRTFENNTERLYLSQTDSSLTFEGEKNELEYITYIFSENQMVRVECQVNGQHTEGLLNYLTERYVLIDDQTSSAIWVTPDYATKIIMNLRYGLSWLIKYSKNTTYVRN